MKLKLPYLLLIVFAMLTLAAKDNESEYLIKERQIPQEYIDTYDFLELLKISKQPIGAFNPIEAPRWDVNKVMEYISKDSVIFVDPNYDEITVKTTYLNIEKALTVRKGKIFNTFAHLSHIYSIPYKHYSELKFFKTGNSVIVYLAGWYKLEFINNEGRYKLIKCEYLQREID
jgi:hypothetical protein